MFVCEFCGKELSTKVILKNHQEKAKYCLEKQNKNIQSDIVCEFCFKVFSSKQRKNTHEGKCQSRIEYERMVLSSIKLDYEKVKNDNESLKLKYESLKLKYEKLKEDNESLKIDKEKQRSEIYSSLYKEDQAFILEQSKRLAEKSGTTTNTTTNNIRGKNITMNSLNLSRERIDSLSDTYTINHYDKGGVGQAEWATDNLLRDSEGNLIYRCTDKNRKNFTYRDEYGNTVNDLHAKKLKEAIKPMIETKLKEYKKVKCDELVHASDDDSELLDKYCNLYRENKTLGIEFDKRLVETTYTG